MTVEQWVALLGVAALIATAIAGLIKAITDMFTAFRRRDDKPAPEVGIPALPPDDDIDYRAYRDMERDRDMWRAIVLRQRDVEPPEPPAPPTT